MGQIALHLEQVDFTWSGRRAYRIAVPEFSVQPAQRVFITGPSGSGKTSLLNLIAGIVVPESGRIMIGEHDMASLSGSRRDRLRADSIGFVFQQLNLVPYLSPIQNVCLPTRFSRHRLANVQHRPEKEAARLLKEMGLEGFAVKGSAAELSVGQQQRVAAARALLGAPTLILADEPTSALDAQSRDQFMSVLLTQAKTSDAAVIMVSHDLSLAPYFDTVISLTDMAETGYRT